MLVIFNIIIASVAYAANYPYTDSSNSVGWTQDWTLTDEFWNQNKLDSSKWYDYNPGWLGRQPGLFDADNVAVNNGKLYMNAGIDWNMKQEYKNKGFHTFTTSAVTAKNSLLYGYVEIKAKVGGSRVSSAFWLSNDDRGGSGTWTEIDIFEQAGTVRTKWNDYHIFHSNTHIFALAGTSPNNLASKCGCTGTSDCKDPGWWSKDSITSFSDDYHIYGMWWTSSFIKLYVDGELVRTIENKCLHQELYLKFDRETFPNWFGLPETSDLPDAPFIIEYVRTWKQTGNGGNSGSSSYITIENKDGINQWWYAVRVSGVPDGVTVTSIKMKDADMSSWKSGTDKKWYWSWYGDGPYSAPFDFKVKLSTGQEITSWDLIKNRNVGTSGTMSTAARSAYTEDVIDDEGMNGTEIGVMIALIIIACICIGLFCVYRRKRKIMNNQVDKLEIKDEVETPVDSKDEVDGYDMSPVTTGDKPTSGNEEIEIDVTVDIEQQA